MCFKDKSSPISDVWDKWMFQMLLNYISLNTKKLLLFHFFYKKTDVYYNNLIFYNWIIICKEICMMYNYCTWNNKFLHKKPLLFRRFSWIFKNELKPLHFQSLSLGYVCTIESNKPTSYQNTHTQTHTQSTADIVPLILMNVFTFIYFLLLHIVITIISTVKSYVVT